MRFEKIDALPHRTMHIEALQNKAPKHDLLGFLIDFIESDAEYAKVVIDSQDYKNTYSAYISLQCARKHHGLSVGIRTINGEVYLVKAGVN